MKSKVPSFSAMIQPTLEILNLNKQEMHIKEINDQLFSRMGLDKLILNNMHKDTNQSEFEYRAGWARTYLKKYGVLINPDRGIWKVCDTYNDETINADDIVNAVRNGRIYESTNKTKISFDITLNNEKLINELSKKYEKNKLALFLGAGVSISANLPSWETLVARFLVSRFKEESEEDIDEEILNELVELERVNRESSLISQTRFIKQNIEPEKYLELLTESLYLDADRIDLDSTLLNSLIKLIRYRNVIKIKKIVSFNFDNVLEKKFKQSDIYYKSCTGFKEEIDKEAVCIYHVHGFLPPELKPDEINYEDIIFSEEQYHALYNDSYNWSNIVQVSILRENTCSCSLTDPNMRRLLDIANKGNVIKQYAILKKEEIELPKGNSINSDSYKLYQNFHIQNRNSYFNSLGIHVIWIDDFNDIPTIISKIVGS